MDTIELCRRVVATCTAHHFRERDDGGGLEAHPWTRFPEEPGEGWVLMDLFTAGAIVAVANQLNDANRAKLAGLHPIHAQDVCLALVERASLGGAH